MAGPGFNDRWKCVYGEMATCKRCGRRMPITQLNAEAIHHHGAHVLECIDRKECERAKKGWKR